MNRTMSNLTRNFLTAIMFALVASFAFMSLRHTTVAGQTYDAALRATELPAEHIHHNTQLLPSFLTFLPPGQ